MTKLLDQAIAEVSKLSTEEQDAVARVILDEIEDERHWHAKFAASGDLLSRMAAEARAEVGAGEIRVGDPSDSAE